MKSKIVLFVITLIILFLLGLLHPKSVQYDKNKSLVQIFKITSTTPKKPIVPKDVSRSMPIIPQEVSRGMSESDLLGYEVVKVMKNFEMTFYDLCRKCVGTNTKGLGASGRKVIPFKSVAVDENIIPLGTYIFIEGYGVLRCDDTGNFEGKRVDLFTNLTHKENFNKGKVNNLTIYILKKVD